MCDYSLMSFPNRLAKEGEKLVVHRFSGGSLGLASPTDLHRPAEAAAVQPQSWWTTFREWLVPAQGCPVTAVCIPPSARLIMHDIPAEFQSEYHVKAEEEVTFEQLSADAHSYRDAVRFRNGHYVKLQELHEGQTVTVVDLGGRESDEDIVPRARSLVHSNPEDRD